MVITLSPPSQFSSKHSFSPSITTHNFQTFHQLIITHKPTSNTNSNKGRRNSFVVRAYVENPNPLAGFVSKVIGSLPVIGLIARIANAEGGLAGDIIDFAEFRRRVGNKCTVNDSRAFYEFQVRHGKVCFFFFSLMDLLF